MSIFVLGLQNFNAIYIYAHILKVYTSCVRDHYFFFFVVECAQTRGVIISRNEAY